MRLPVIMANLLNLQGIGDVLNANLRINGLNHLWFMTSIMIAYFSLPLFQKGRNRSLLLYVLLIFLWILVFMFVTPRVMWGLEWILLFGTGYIRTFIVSQHPKRNIMESLDIMILIFTIFFATQIGIENLSSNYDKLNRIFHVLLGLSLTIWGMKMLEWLKIKKIPSLIKFFDKYSFHIYLVHFVFMIGPLSFAHVAKYDGVNIVIMLSLSAIFTFLLIMVLGFVNRQLLCKI